MQREQKITLGKMQSNGGPRLLMRVHLPHFRRNAPGPGSLRVMGYNSADIAMLIITTLAVAVFVTYIAFGPAN
jgi:hypothetical protein